MQKESKGYLTAQFLNELSRNGPKLLGDAAGDVIGLIRSLMPSSAITKMLSSNGTRAISSNKPRNALGTFDRKNSIPSNFPR